MRFVNILRADLEIRSNRYGQSLFIFEVLTEVFLFFDISFARGVVVVLLALGGGIGSFLIGTEIVVLHIVITF